MPIHISNIAIAGSDDKPTRVGFRFDKDRKVRFAKRTGDTLDG
jgi:large subunit ribosomal protein L24